jgi:hypothetical protein
VEFHPWSERRIDNLADKIKSQKASPNFDVRGIFDSELKRADSDYDFWVVDAPLCGYRQ